MSTVKVKNSFLLNSRGFSFGDTATTVWSFNALTNTLTADVVVAAGSIADNAVTNAKLADMAQSTIKGRTAGAGTGDPVDLTVAQVKTILSLASTDVSDFTEASQDAAASLIQNGTGISWTYNDAANTLTPAVSLAAFSTTNLSEGLNLYYTDERVQDAAALLIQNGTGISWTYNDAAATLTPAVSLAAFSTTNLSEGSNLYYTDERAQDAVGTILTDSSSIDFTYNDGANTITAAVLPAGVDHNSLSNFVANKHIDHTAVTLTAGAGLTGGGDISASRSFAVGAGTGITVNADDVAVDQTFTPTWTGFHTFTAVSGRYLEFIDSTAAADSKNVLFRSGGGGFNISSATDAAPTAAFTNLITSIRSGTSWTDLRFGNSTDNTAFRFQGTGNVRFDGSTTGTQTATFTATNKPGSATAGPIAWIPVLTAAGTQGYIPIFGA